MADADVPALLEWLDLVDASGGAGGDRRWEEVADGEILLRVMHDLDPEGFPSPDARFGRPGYCPPSEYVVKLLEGLEVYLRGRGGDETCSRLLAEANSGGSVDPRPLTKLVLIATVEIDVPRRTHYIEKMLSLSISAQAVVRGIVERFQTGAGLESPSAGRGDNSIRSAARNLAKECSFGVGYTPPSRSATARDVGKPLLDFMEVGIDTETRFRRLKDQYIANMEELERVSEERSILRQELEVEQTKRQEADEAERVARTELRLADEARERVKEEQRSLFDLKIDQEVGRYKERLREREYELEAVREDLALLQAQAASAQKLTQQLDTCKKKLEEHQALRHENEEMRKQLEELMTRPGAGAGDHLHRSLARAREEALAVSRERDEAQRQGELLREELEREQATSRKAVEELAAFRRQGGLAGASSPGTGAGGAAVGSALALEAGAAILAASATDREAAHTRSPKGSASAQEVKLLNQQKDDLLERLLSEKERAARAEATLQAKVSEASSLQELRAKDATKLAQLEAQVQSLQKQMASPPSAGSAAAVPAQDSSAETQELKRAFQVCQARARSDSHTFAIQEVHMASCFHELGLKYHKQRILEQNKGLLRRMLKGGGGATG